MSSGILKIIALILMFISHIHTFIPKAPVIFLQLGRLSAPLFLFTMVWGFHYTRNKKKYLTNLYLWGLAMAAGDVLISVLVPNALQAPTNNIFVTLFLVGYICYIIESFKAKQTKQAIVLIGLLLIGQILSFGTHGLMQQLFPQVKNIVLIPFAIGANLFYCEGSFVFVALGVALYLFKDKPKYLAIAYSIGSIMMYMAQETAFTLKNLFIDNPQWMMIFALPLILAYNGQKGPNPKWLFYIFYPAHIFFLCWLGSVVSF